MHTFAPSNIRKNMDKSWNFLKDLQNDEMSTLVTALENKGIKLQDKNAYCIVDALSMALSDNKSSITYDPFLDRIAYMYSIEGWDCKDTLDEKELAILVKFIQIIIDGLDEGGIECFNKEFSFSNFEKEKLKLQVKTRVKTNKRFRRFLPHVIMVMSYPNLPVSLLLSYGVQQDAIKQLISFRESFGHNGQSCDMWFFIVGILIKIRQEYNCSIGEDNEDLNIPEKTARDYLDSIIRIDNTFDSQKLTTISIMLCLYKAMHKESEQNREIITEVSDFLGNREIPIRLNNITIEEYGPLMRYLMNRLFPREVQTQGALKMNDNKVRKSNNEERTAFFYYSFPYSSVLDAWYALPEKKEDCLAIKLYFAHKNGNIKRLIDRDGLIRIIQNSKDADCWQIVLPKDGNKNMFPTATTIIQSDYSIEQSYRDNNSDFETKEKYDNALRNGEISEEYLQEIESNNSPNIRDGAIIGSDADEAINMIKQQFLKAKDFLVEIIDAWNAEYVSECDKLKFDETTSQLDKKIYNIIEKRTIAFSEKIQSVLDGDDLDEWIYNFKDYAKDINDKIRTALDKHILKTKSMSENCMSDFTKESVGENINRLKFILEENLKGFLRGVDKGIRLSELSDQDFFEKYISEEMVYIISGFVKHTNTEGVVSDEDIEKVVSEMKDECDRLGQELDLTREIVDNTFSNFKNKFTSIISALKDANPAIQNYFLEMSDKIEGFDKQIDFLNAKLYDEKKRFQKKHSSQMIAFKCARHNMAPKIGCLKNLIHDLKSNIPISPTSIKSAENAIDDIEGIIKFEEETPQKINIVAELDSLVQKNEHELYSIEKVYSEEDQIFVKIGKYGLGQVITNIFENIKNHAFSAPNLKNRVKIEIVQKNRGYVYVIFSNNGSPFCGSDSDKRKVFDLNTKYGSSGHSGVGLFDVKRKMEEWGGDAEFISKPNEEFCVIMKLKFKTIK